eukprot:101954-Alexandrium_andersonii.AAC.1
MSRLMERAGETTALRAGAVLRSLGAPGPVLDASPTPRHCPKEGGHADGTTGGQKSRPLDR